MKGFMALGRAAPKSSIGLAVQPKTTEQKIERLETIVSSLMEANAKLRGKRRGRELNAYEGQPTNRHGIPIGLSLLGLTKWGARILTVTKDGYYIGQDRYNSLSAAAEATSGIIRKSGWVFWKLPDGRTAKQVFKGT